jgi:predicted metal-dependent hydrolase
MPLSFTLIRSKRRTVALVVRADGTLLVRAPLRLAEEHIRAFVESKADWVRKKQAEAQVVQKNVAPPHRYREGEKFPYLGQLYPLAIVDRARPALSLEGERFLLARSAQPKAAHVFELWYRRQAARVLAERVSAYGLLFEQTGDKYSRIRISSARTRWGSCSSKGTLSFTWRLVTTPLAVIDYVVVHELAHLRFKNHSKDFWQLVKTFIRDYEKRRAWLKANGELTTLA